MEAITCTSSESQSDRSICLVVCWGARRVGTTTHTYAHQRNTPIRSPCIGQGSPRDVVADRQRHVQTARVAYQALSSVAQDLATVHSGVRCRPWPTLGPC